MHANRLEAAISRLTVHEIQHPRQGLQKVVKTIQKNWVIRCSGISCESLILKISYICNVDRSVKLECRNCSQIPSAYIIFKQKAKLPDPQNFHLQNGIMKILYAGMVMRLVEPWAMVGSK